MKPHGDLEIPDELDLALNHVPTVGDCPDCGTPMPRCQVRGCKDGAHSFLEVHTGPPAEAIYLCDRHSYTACFTCGRVDDEASWDEGLCEDCRRANADLIIETGEYACCNLD
jgi:hypothetical protein